MIKHGIRVPTVGRPQDTAAYAKKVEAAGFDFMLIPDTPWLAGRWRVVGESCSDGQMGARMLQGEGVIVVGSLPSQVGALACGWAHRGLPHRNMSKFAGRLCGCLHCARLLACARGGRIRSTALGVGVVDSSCVCKGLGS